MKNKFIFIITGILALMAIFCAPVFADEESVEAPEPVLFFRAVNAGYKNDESAQNYDFFELAKTAEGDLDLSNFRVQYFNSSDKLAGELEFTESTVFRANTAVFGYSKSPQFADVAPRYLYNFGTAGLASTAGRLVILQDDTIIDEICWGKIACTDNAPKFATSQEENRTALRLLDYSFIQTDYYPGVSEDSLYLIEPEEPEEVLSCEGLKITEIYSYYEESSSEQFVEILNASDAEILLDACVLRYKSKDYPMQGQLVAGQYTLIQDLALTKDPSSELSIEIIDATGPVEIVSYAHGQKKGTSLALLDGQ